MARTLPAAHARTHSTEITRLESQLRAAFEGPAWHGPAVLELLRGVTPAEAAARPIAGAHTIWEIVLHLTATYDVVLRRLRGDGKQLTPDEDWPPMAKPTDANWQEAIAALHGRNEATRAAVLRFDATKLSAPLVPEPPYSAYEQFIGLTQHDLYHAGQIALLERAIRGAGAG
jgi:uncharacterized damage-inducible protein DinB